MKQLTRDEIVEIIEDAIKDEEEFERLFYDYHRFEEAVRHTKNKHLYEGLIAKIKEREAKK